MKMQALITALVFAVSGTAFAQTSQTARDPAATPRLDQRQANQEKRIEQGVASGQLTEKEAARMEKRDKPPRLMARSQRKSASNCTTRPIATAGPSSAKSMTASMHRMPSKSPALNQKGPQH